MWTRRDLDLLEERAAQQARESFWAFRLFTRPQMIRGWWQRLIAHELQRFYDDLCAGKRPKLVIEAPPQHGKSIMAVDFIAWASGKNPDLKTIYTSFSERLGLRANLQLQRIMDGRAYRRAFPDTRLNKRLSSSAAHTATRNREMLEYDGRDGYFRNTTVRGSITGESLDLGVIDDPIKGREEAGSASVRDKTWDWFTDDFFTRFSEDAGMLAILTRWHVDDPIGRLRAQMGDAVRVVSYPAIAEKDEPHRKAGEPLFPELKSLDFLLERKAAMASVHWEALYQQNPVIEGGNIIKGEWFPSYDVAPRMKWRAVYVDTAQKTGERHDFTVAEEWGLGDDGKLYLLDMLRGRFEVPDLERRLPAFWAKCAARDSSQWGALRAMKIEDAASGTGLIQKLRREHRFPVVGITRKKDKYSRCLDVLGYISSGYVCIPRAASFTSDFLAECEAFTADDSHAHDDQLDPMFDAIGDMLAGGNKVEQFRNLI